MGDSELILKQIKGEYSVYNPILGQQRETVLDFIDLLLECNFSTVSRKKIIQAHSLENFASTCNLPFQPNHKYTAKVKHRSII